VKLADQQLVRLMGPSIGERDIERPPVDSSGVRRLPRGCGAMNAHAIEADFGYDGLGRQPAIVARDPGDGNAP
jgi:hypothetical protein